MSLGALARRHGPLPVVPLLLALAYRELASWQPGRDLVQGVQGWMFASSNTSPLLVLGVALLFAWNRRARLARALRRGRPDARGWLLMLPAAALFVWASHTRAPDLLLVSLVASVLGSSLLCRGRRLLRTLLLPTLVLLFAFPIPAVIVNEVVFRLQMWTAEATTWVLERLGVAVLHHGDLLYARGQLFEVIETCSGMGLIEAILLAAVLYGELLCRRGLHALLLALAAPFVGFLVNLGRAVTLVLHPDSQVLAIHLLQGMLFLLAGVLALVPIEWALRRWLPGPPAPGRVAAPARDDAPAATRSDTAVWMLVALLALLAAAAGRVPTWAEPGRPPWGMRMPLEWEDWRARGHLRDKAFLGSVAYAHTVERRYVRGDEVVAVFVGAEDHRQRDRSFRSPKNAYPGSGWRIDTRRRREIAAAPGEILELTATSQGGRALVWLWYEGLASAAAELARALLALDASRCRDPELDFVVRLSTPLGRGEAERRAAEERLRELSALVRASLDALPARRSVDRVSERP